MYYELRKKNYMHCGTCHIRSYGMYNSKHHLYSQISFVRVAMAIFFHEFAPGLHAMTLKKQTGPAYDTDFTDRDRSQSI